MYFLDLLDMGCSIKNYLLVLGEGITARIYKAEPFFNIEFVQQLQHGHVQGAIVRVLTYRRYGNIMA